VNAIAPSVGRHAPSGGITSCKEVRHEYDDQLETRMSSEEWQAAGECVETRSVVLAARQHHRKRDASHHGPLCTGAD
jgi:hypothetical protein